LGLTVAVSGLGLAHHPSARSEGIASVDTTTFGQRHLELVQSSVVALSSHEASSGKGLHILVNELRKKSALSEEQAKFLHETVDKVEKDLQDARQFLEVQMQNAKRVGGELIDAIASIVSKSILWCMEFAARLPSEEKKRIVMKDFAGAIQGAIAGIGLGSIAAFSGISIPLLAAGGALAGSAASSL
ncbi:unnamed protein product, partial [Phaeothamnion confervicola]